MATRLYLHAAANTLSGTLPTAEQSTRDETDHFGTDTLRSMDTTIGVSETFITVTSSEDINHVTLVGRWVTPPLSAQTLIANSFSDLNIQYALEEDSASMNIGGDVDYSLYLWRPSTGTLVDMIANGTPFSGEAEPSAINTQKFIAATDTTINGGTVTCEEGDVLIFELWMEWNPSTAGTYTATFYLDGTDDATYADNTTVSDTASYIEFPNDTFSFQVLTNDFNMDATASVTWGGSSTATSNLNSAATASLTWTGNGIYPAAFSSDAAATLEWGGLTINVQAAAFEAAATASLTWNGAAVAASALDTDAAGALTWSGASEAASALTAAAAASLTWSGASEVTSAYSVGAAALLEWVGTGDATSAAALEAAAAATLTWGGTGLAPGAFDSDAAATLEAHGASVASANWNAAAVADLQWIGEEIAPAGEGYLTITSTADLVATGESIAAAAASIEAVASLTFRGTDAAPAAERNIDGRVRRRAELDRIEEIEEEDIMILTAALYSYLEQCNGYH